MFQVVEVGPLTKKTFFRRRQQQPIKLRCIKAASCEKIGRTFEGYQRYTTQTYRVEFSEGDTITLWVSGMWVAVGDQMSIEVLAGQGYLDRYFRLVATESYK